MIYDTKQKSLSKHLFCWPKEGRGPGRPTWLVKTANMVKVPGSESGTIGYCTLSYSQRSPGSFHQSPHTLITYPDDKQTAQKVTFNEMLQQICADFDIEYLWYDQMCIDPSPEQKLEEIKDMLFYHGFARFTIALIPEMELVADDAPPVQALHQCLQFLRQSEWSQSLWTYRDTALSKNILFVGKNVHFSSDQLRRINSEYARLEYPLIDTIEELISPPQSAAAMLLHAHARHCDNPYDRVFLLATIFRKLVYRSVDQLCTYARQSESPMIVFYKELVKEDLTVMCFGKGAYTSRHCNLPSWTGVSGTHCSQVLKTSLPKELSCSIEDSCMRISCDYISVVPKQCTRDKSTDVSLGIEKVFGVEVTHCATGAPSENPHRKLVAYMSLTDIDCGKCVVLDIPFDSDRGFCCPVATKQQNGRYRAIGVCFYTLMDWSFVELSKGVLYNFGSKSNATFVIE